MATAQYKILVVDDDPTLIKLLTSIFEDEGFQVVTAKDGLDGIVMVQKERPDLIVLDVMMPELNGYDVCRNLKFDPQYQKIPIILLTARDQELDGRIGKLLGIEYVQKPFERHAFLALVKKLLGL